MFSFFLILGEKASDMDHLRNLKWSILETFFWMLDESYILSE